MEIARQYHYRNTFVCFPFIQHSKQPGKERTILLISIRNVVGKLVIARHRATFMNMQVHVLSANVHIMCKCMQIAGDV